MGEVALSACSVNALSPCNVHLRPLSYERGTPLHGVHQGSDRSTSLIKKRPPLGPDRRTSREHVLFGRALNYRGTSLIRRRPPPQDPNGGLCLRPYGGPGEGGFLVS